MSIGANLLIKYAGEKKEKCKLKCIVSISNPWDITACVENLQHWTKIIYN